MSYLTRRRKKKGGIIHSSKKTSVEGDISTNATQQFLNELDITSNGKLNPSLAQPLFDYFSVTSPQGSNKKFLKDAKDFDNPLNKEAFEKARSRDRKAPFYKQSTSLARENYLKIIDKEANLQYQNLIKESKKPENFSRNLLLDETSSFYNSNRAQKLLDLRTPNKLKESDPIFQERVESLKKDTPAFFTQSRFNRKDIQKKEDGGEIIPAESTKMVQNRPTFFKEDLSQLQAMDARIGIAPNLSDNYNQLLVDAFDSPDSKRYFETKQAEIAHKLLDKNKMRDRGRNRNLKQKFFDGGLFGPKAIQPGSKGPAFEMPTLPSTLPVSGGFNGGGGRRNTNALSEIGNFATSNIDYLTSIGSTIANINATGQLETQQTPILARYKRSPFKSTLEDTTRLNQASYQAFLDNLNQSGDNVSLGRSMGIAGITKANTVSAIADAKARNQFDLRGDRLEASVALSNTRAQNQINAANLGRRNRRLIEQTSAVNAGTQDFLNVLTNRQAGNIQSKELILEALKSGDTGTISRIAKDMGLTIKEFLQILGDENQTF